MLQIGWYMPELGLMRMKDKMNLKRIDQPGIVQIRSLQQVLAVLRMNRTNKHLFLRNLYGHG